VLRLLPGPVRARESLARLCGAFVSEPVVPPSRPSFRDVLHWVLPAADDPAELLQPGQDLTPGQQRMFRRLGLHLGPDIDAFAAAAADGSDLHGARRTLEALYGLYLTTAAGLARCALAAGRTVGAQAGLRQAREIFQRIGAAEAADVSAELDTLTETGPAAER
jgi:hypothetical protein